MNDFNNETNMDQQAQGHAVPAIDLTDEQIAKLKEVADKLEAAKENQEPVEVV